MIILINWKKKFSGVFIKIRKQTGLSLHETQVFRFKVITNTPSNPFCLGSVPKDFTDN